MRGFGVCKHRLESDTEAANLLVIIRLGSFAYICYSLNILNLKRSTVMLVG